MPTTNSPKPAIIPVRLTPAQAAQVAELTAAGWGNQSDVIRTAIDRMHKEEKQRMELSQTEQADALQIAQDVISNGRVLTTKRGTWNKESLRVEVSFEASEHGYDSATAEAMGRYAVQNAV